MRWSLCARSWCGPRFLFDWFIVCWYLACSRRTRRACCGTNRFSGCSRFPPQRHTSVISRCRRQAVGLDFSDCAALSAAARRVDDVNSMWAAFTRAAIPIVVALVKELVAPPGAQIVSPRGHAWARCSNAFCSIRRSPSCVPTAGRGGVRICGRCKVRTAASNDGQTLDQRGHACAVSQVCPRRNFPQVCPR